MKILEPIEEKIRFWINYEKGLPQIPYRGNEIFFDEYRGRYDLDCQILGGNLNADTIISLWNPLRLTLTTLHSEEELNQRLGVVNKRQNFLQKLLNAGLEEFLNPEEEVVELLSELFYKGQQRENVILLNNRGLNAMRGAAPYHDYLPYFLKDCFKGGPFSHIFNHDDQLLRDWIMREDLQLFFDDGYLVPEAILDIAGAGDITIDHPPKGENLEESLDNLAEMLSKYVDILTERRTLLELQE